MSKAIELADWADWFCRNVKDPEDFRWKHMAESSAELRRLQAEVERLSANLQPSVPDGWRLVPVKSTTDMRVAYQRSRDDGFEAAYRAMLAAAPQPPADREHIEAAIARDVGAA